LRAGREHRARQLGRAKSGSERAGGPFVAQTPHGTWHRAHRRGPRGTVDGEREERGQKRPCALPSSWGRVHPNADPRKQGEAKKEGARQARWWRWRRLPEQERERQKSMQEGAEEGRGRKAPPRSSWASELGRPRPSGPRRAGRPKWAELPSSPCSEPGAASSRAWSPAAPSVGSGVPSLPWGWG
jgi:hypothetical protein